MSFAVNAEQIAAMIESVEITQDAYGISVSPIWRGVDRPNVGGIVVSKITDAHRVRACMSAGAFWRSAMVQHDVNGQSYVSAPALVVGRYLNADLKKLGF